MKLAARKPTDTYTVVNIILRRGNEPGIFTEWFAGMQAWADANTGPDAAALRAWLPVTKAQPFYAAHHLAMFWPAIKLTLGIETRMVPEPTPNRLANELKFCGLPVLRNANGTTGFFYAGHEHPCEFFIVEHVPRWTAAPLSQEDFNHVILNR